MANEFQWYHSRRGGVLVNRHLPSRRHQDGVLLGEEELVDMARGRIDMLRRFLKDDKPDRFHHLGRICILLLLGYQRDVSTGEAGSTWSVPREPKEA